jgi:hypothetical protein
MSGSDSVGSAEVDGYADGSGFAAEGGGKEAGRLVVLEEFAGVVVDEAAAEHGGVEGEEFLVGDEREAVVGERGGGLRGLFG